MIEEVLDEIIDRANPEGVTIKIKYSEAIDLLAFLTALERHKPKLYNELQPAETMSEQIKKSLGLR